MRHSSHQRAAQISDLSALVQQKLHQIRQLEEERRALRVRVAVLCLLLRLLEERTRHRRRLAAALGERGGPGDDAADLQDEFQAEQLMAMLAGGPAGGDGGAEQSAAVEASTRHIPHLAPGLELAGLDRWVRACWRPAVCVAQ
jgi:hypothetical protein